MDRRNAHERYHLAVMMKDGGKIRNHPVPERSNKGQIRTPAKANHHQQTNQKQGIQNQLVLVREGWEEEGWMLVVQCTPVVRIYCVIDTNIPQLYV